VEGRGSGPCRRVGPGTVGAVRAPVQAPGTVGIVVGIRVPARHGGPAIGSGQAPGWGARLLGVPARTRVGARHWAPRRHLARWLPVVPHAPTWHERPLDRTAGNDDPPAAQALVRERRRPRPDEVVPKFHGGACVLVGVDRLPPWIRTHVRLNNRRITRSRASLRRGSSRWQRWWRTWPPRTWTACPTRCGPSGSLGCGGCWTGWKASGWPSWLGWTPAGPPAPTRMLSSAPPPAGCGPGSAWAPGPPPPVSGPPGPCSAAPAQTATALTDGQLSPAHARVLAVGTHQLPAPVTAEAEPVLVEVARRLDPARLRQLVAHLGLVADPDGAQAKAERHHQRRGACGRPRPWRAWWPWMGCWRPRPARACWPPWNPWPARPAPTMPAAAANAGLMPWPSWPAGPLRAGRLPQAGGSGPS
jgi:Domain of unknown function (DUF222)